MSQCFPIPHCSYEDIKLELHLCYYATKSEIKKLMCIDISHLPWKAVQLV